MIVEDRMDVASAITTGKPPVNPILGGVRPGLIYESNDGIQWEQPEIGYRRNTFYFGGKVNRMERPHILWKDERPDYIFFALSGPGITIRTGCGAVLKIGDW